MLMTDAPSQPTSKLVNFEDTQTAETRQKDLLA